MVIVFYAQVVLAVGVAVTCVLSEESGDVLVASFFIVTRSGAIKLTELVEDHGGAFRGLFCFRFRSVEEDGSPEFAHVVSA